jgi:transcriptional regulator with XRE-family HTH domain
MTVTEATRTLRELSGLSQQFLATKLNMSTRALSQYESGKTPEPKQLLALCAYAYKAERRDLCRVFIDTLNREMDVPSGFRVDLHQKKLWLQLESLVPEIQTAAERLKDKGNADGKLIYDLCNDMWLVLEQIFVSNLEKSK